MAVQHVQRRLFHRRLFHPSVAAIATVILALLAFLGTAHAGQGRPVSGRDYVRQGSGDGTSIRIWIKPEARIYAPGLAEVFRTTVKTIRALNPEQTVALCYDPKRRKPVQSKAVTKDPKTRATNEIWEGCAEENQWIYVFPGSVLTLPDPMAKIMEEKLAAEDETPAPAKGSKEPSSEKRVEPDAPLPAPSPPAIVPPAPPVVAERPSDDGRSFKEKLLAANALTVGFKRENDRLNRLTAQAEERLDTIKGLLRDKEGEIANLRANVIPTGTRYLFLTAMLVLMAGLVFTSFKLRTSRIEIASLKEEAESMKDRVAQLNENLECANLARKNAEHGHAASDRACIKLEGDMVQARRIGTERRARILELEAAESRRSADSEAERVSHRNAERALKAERERLSQENTELWEEADKLNGANIGLRADVERLQSEVEAKERDLRNLRFQAAIRQEAIEDDARAVSELPGPTEGDQRLSELASRLSEEEEAPPVEEGSPFEEAVRSATRTADELPGAQGDDEEPCPATVAGVAPPGDLPVEPRVNERPRVPTLPQGMRHMADLLLPGSGHRNVFFDAAEAICEAAAHVGGVKIIKRGEISSLNKLAKLWFEVDTPNEGVKPVRIQDFADDARVLTFHPVET